MNLFQLSIIRRRKPLFLIAFIIVIFSGSAVAQASLASEDVIEDVPVTIKGEKLSYTLVRDASQQNQWYYLPANIRLYEKAGDKGRPEPEFNLIKYQFKNPKNSQELLEGGVLQFAVNMSPDNDAMNQLRSFITKKTNQPGVRLSGLPLKSATVALITPKGEFVADGAQTEGIAPTQANQKMVFSIPLTRIGADVYEALTNSNTGMGVAVKYNYNGLTPPAGFKITVDWDQTYTFLSKDEVVRNSVGASGIWGSLGLAAAYKTRKETQDIRQKLIDSRCITIEATQGENFDQSAMEKYLDPIIQKITEELYQKSNLTNRIDTLLLAQAVNADVEAPTAKGIKPNWFSFSMSHSKSTSLKNISLVKKGKQTYTMNVKQLVNRVSIAGGFVGLGKYADDIKNKLVTVVPQGKWESAFFILPSVSDDDGIGINQVDLQVGLKNKDMAYNTQVVVWTREKGWVDKDGHSRNVIAFPMMEFAKKDESLKNIQFDLTANISVGRDVLQVHQQIKTINGESAVSTPLALVDVISVQPEMLSFHLLNPDSKLDFANITLTDGVRTFSKKLSPFSQGGTPIAPKPIYWLIPRDSAHQSVKADVVFNLHDSSVVHWKNSQKSVYDPEVGLQILLRDVDYN